MSNASVSELRNRLNLNRMFYDFQNHDVPSEGNQSVDAEVVKSSNCVINIDYVVQEEKISFEVFRSSMDSNCVFRKKFSLRQSKSCTQLNSTENPLYKTSKLVQTNDSELPQLLSRSNLGPPMFKKDNFEHPVKDNTNIVNSYDMYKENYGVSNFKFAQNQIVVEEQSSNYCSLEFDGTRSTKKNYYRTKIKHNHIKRVRSNIDIKKQTRFQSPVSKPEGNDLDFNAYNYTGFEHQFPQEIAKKSKHKSRERKCRDMQNNDDVTFQFALAPKNETFDENVDELESIEPPKHKHRKIIVTSNTLQPTVKPNMKNFQQQTNLTELYELAGNSSSVNELYIKPNFRASRQGSTYTEVKRKKKIKNMTITIFPCMEIKSSQYEADVPSYQKRPTMPRRKIGPASTVSLTDSDITQSLKNEIDSIEKLKKLKSNRSSDTEKKPEEIEQECENICTKLTKMLKKEKKSAQYNQKIDELCILINTLLREKSRSRSQSPVNKANTNNTINQEVNKVSTPKLENLKITNNKKDNISIMSTICNEAPNLVPRNILKVSPRANEIFKSQENKRRNVSVSNQLSIMPDPEQLEQVKYVDSKKTQVMYTKQKESISSSKKPVESKINCSTVTFSSQVAIMGKTTESVNEENLKNTLFPVNQVLFKRSKTLPSKPDFNGTTSINSIIASSFAGDLSSFSNSDICSITEDKPKVSKPKTNISEKPKSPKPGAIENSTFLRSKSNVPTNCFQKRKEYYKNLKFKMRNKLYSPDFGRISESNNDSETPSLDNIAKPQTNKESKLNTTVSVTKNENKNIISSKELVSKNDKKSTLFPFTFTNRNENSGKNTSHVYPSGKNISPHTVEDVKQRISNFLQSYPLEIASPHMDITTPPASIKDQPIIHRQKSKLPKRI